MYRKSGNHGKLLNAHVASVYVMCAHAARMYRLFDVALLRFPTISSLLLRRVAHWLNYSPTLSIFRLFSAACEFYRWSISIARDLHRLPLANTSRCINTNQQLFARTTCSSFSHGTAQLPFRSLFFSLFFWGHTVIIACNHIQTRLAPMMCIMQHLNNGISTWVESLKRW